MSKFECSTQRSIGMLRILVYPVCLISGMSTIKYLVGRVCVQSLLLCNTISDYKTVLFKFFPGLCIRDNASVLNVVKYQNNIKLALAECSSCYKDKYWSKWIRYFEIMPVTKFFYCSSLLVVIYLY